jgi:hypothetical protein
MIARPDSEAAMTLLERMLSAFPSEPEALLWPPELAQLPFAGRLIVRTE